MFRKNHRLTFVLLILALGALVLSACSGSAGAAGLTEEGSSNPRSIAVNGSGKITLTPDLAYISIGVHTENANAEEAVSGNTTQANAVVEALKQFGLEEKDIQTSNFSVYPRQDWGPDGQKVIGITYIVDNTVRVTVRDLSEIGGVLDAVVKAGANNIGGIQFDVADREAAYQQALKAAVENATARAEVAATAAGVSLGDVHSIQTSFGGGPVPVAFEAASFKAAGDVPVSPGQMEITADVSMSFDIQ